MAVVSPIAFEVRASLCGYLDPEDRRVYETMVQLCTADRVTAFSKPLAQQQPLVAEMLGSVAYVGAYLRKQIDSNAFQENRSEQERLICRRWVTEQAAVKLLSVTTQDSLAGLLAQQESVLRQTETPALSDRAGERLRFLLEVDEDRIAPFLQPETLDLLQANTPHEAATTARWIQDLTRWLMQELPAPVTYKLPSPRDITRC